MKSGAKLLPGAKLRPLQMNSNDEYYAQNTWDPKHKNLNKNM